MNWTQIKKMLTGGTTATTEDLKSTLAQLDVAEAERRALQAEETRKAKLLTGSDEELADLEAKVASAWREVERRAVAREEVEKRLAEVAEQEAEGERRVKYDQAMAATADAERALLGSKHCAPRQSLRASRAHRECPSSASSLSTMTATVIV